MATACMVAMIRNDSNIIYLANLSSAAHTAQTTPKIYSAQRSLMQIIATSTHITDMHSFIGKIMFQSIN